MGLVARTIAPLLSALAPCWVSADESLWDSFQVHGFASQAVVYTTHNRFFGDSTKWSTDFTEIGVNASLRPMPRMLLSGQLLYRRAGEMYKDILSLDYGLADITALSSERGRAGLRVGRIKNPLGLYNETRDMPFTRPSIFLPQVVYYDKVRNLVLSSDGLALYGEWFGDNADISLTVAGGQAVIDENVEWGYLGNNWPGDIKPDSTFWTGSLWYTTAGERIKLGLSGAMSSMRFDPHPGSPLQAGTTTFTYVIASFQYNAEDWTISSEYAREPIQWKDFGPYFPYDKATGEGYYLQGAYRIRQDLELMLRYEEGYADRDDRDGSTARAQTGGLNPFFNRYAKTWTAGLRWDINQHLMVRAEYDRHDGTFLLSSRENPDTQGLVREWDLFSLQLSVRF